MSKLAVLANTLFSDGEIRRKQVVLIEDRKIAHVRPASQFNPRDADSVIDLSECTVLPGLIDAHVHFGPEVDAHEIAGGVPFARLFENNNIKLIKSIIDLRNLLAAGFTAARDVGGLRALDLRNAIELGLIPGPRLRCSGRILTVLGGLEDHPYIPVEWVNEISDLARPCADPNDLIQALREQRRAGADFIKIFATGLDTVPQFSDEEIRTVVDEAKRFGLRVSAHALGGPAIRSATLAGCYTLEHGTWITEDDCRVMVETGIIFVPTPAFCYQFANSALDSGAPASGVEAARKRLPQTLESISMAHRMGVKIATGTDFGFRVCTRHGANNLQALFLLHQAGLSATEVLQAATVHAAEALEMGKSIGKIEPGYFADLIAVQGNPLEDIKCLRQLRWVMKDGRVFVNEFAKDMVQIAAQGEI